MNYQEELIFGLIRWMIKGTKYIEKYDDANEVIGDELTFDALSYVILMVSDISKRVLAEDEILEKYKTVNFSELANLKNKIFVQDAIDYTFMFDFVKDDFPMFISALVSNQNKK